MTLIFCGEDATAPPDVVFAKRSFLALRDLETLRQWDASDARQLLRLVLELRHVYQQRQAAVLAELGDARVQFEFQTVRQIAGVECLLDHERGEARLVVPVELSREAVEHLLQPGEGRVADMRLDARFVLGRLDARGQPAPPTLALLAPPSWRALAPEHQLPQWLPDSSLVPYLQALQAQINGVVARERASLQARRELVSALSKQLGPPLEVELPGCSAASFAVQTGRKPDTVLVRVLLGRVYPAAAPVLELQSVQYLSHTGDPLQRRVAQVEHSPQWPPAETAARLRALLKSVLPVFAAKCVEIQVAQDTALQGR